uniref:G_PROTEIN_RECEP_F1_2 domain-containing protein n=1 Tax=Rhabditophanes sp. KR3021 TaxID=114890 RepID=A0AC35UGQ5_9BILA
MQSSMALHSHLVLFNRQRSLKNILESSNAVDTINESSPLMLVMVIILFLVCNIITILVNYFESNATLISFTFQMVMIDIANFLVVLNATANFFVYIIFSNSYRTRLRELFDYQRPTSNSRHVTDHL